MKTAHRDLLEALKEAFEFPVGPVQLFVGGQSFDIASMDTSFNLNDLDHADLLITAKLRDGRDLRFKLSAVDGFVDGVPWE